jgi:hypothetical protein
MTHTTPLAPHQYFQQAIADGIHASIGECWRDFAHWEHARQFADDPSHPAKAAIEWILAWEELLSGLDEFSGGAKRDCRNELDAAAGAFAKLEHSAELLRAVERWLDERRAALQAPP